MGEGNKQVSTAPAVDVQALMDAYWKEAGPMLRCKREQVSLELPAAGTEKEGDDADIIFRDDFLAWLFKVPQGDPAIFKRALEVRSATLKEVADAAPVPAAYADETTVPAVSGEMELDRGLWETIRNRSEATIPHVAALAQGAQHFTAVIEAGLDANAMPFPAMEPPLSWGKRQWYRPLASMPQGQPPNDQPFLMPHTWEEMTLRRPSPDTSSWSESEVEYYENVLVPGLATRAEELRRAICGEPALVMEVTPWPSAREGVIVSDTCLEAQLTLIQEREKRGHLSERALKKRRGEGFNARVLEEVLPVKERDEALAEMKARWERDRAADAEAYDTRAKEGESFVEWPTERKWAPQSAKWAQRGRWLKMWRSKPRTPKPDASIPGKPGLHRCDSTASMKSWVALSDISWVDVESRAAEVGWQAVMGEDVEPQMQHGLEKVDSLSKADITELKALCKPPVMVITTVECVLAVLGYKERSWDVCKACLADVSFLSLLINLDYVSASSIEAASPYLANESFTPDHVKKSSSACEGLCSWARSVVRLHAYKHAAADAKYANEEKKKTEQLLEETAKALDGVTEDDLREVGKSKRTPDVAGLVGAVLHLLAGLHPAIPPGEKGGAKDFGWEAFIAISPGILLEALKGYPGSIKSGKVDSRNVSKARKILQGMGIPYTREVLQGRSCKMAGVLFLWVENSIACYENALPPSVRNAVPSAIHDEPSEIEAPMKELCSTVSKAAIQELKSLTKPPVACLTVVTLVGAMLGQPVNTWKEMQVMMSDPASFASRLSSLNVRGIPESTVQAVESSVSKESLTVNKVQGQSLAAAHMLGWVLTCVKIHKLLPSDKLRPRSDAEAVSFPMSEEN